MERKWLTTFLVAGGIFILIIGIFLWSEGYFRVFSLERMGGFPIRSLFFSEKSEPEVRREEISNNTVLFSSLSHGQDTETSSSISSLPTINTPPLRDTEETLFRSIKTAFSLKQYDTTLSLATSYLSQYSKGTYYFPVIHLVASVFYHQRNFEDALLWCRKAIAESIPTTYEVSFASLTGFILKDSEKTDPALLSWMEQIYLRHPQENTSALVVGIAYQYLYRNDPKTALAYLQESRGELALLGKGRAYISMQNYPAAIQEYENFFSFYPESPRKEGVKQAFLRQTLYYARTQAKANPTTAITSYEKLWRFPESQEAEEGRLEMVSLLRNMKMFDKALQSAKTGLLNANKSRDPHFLFHMAGISYDMNQKNESLALYEQFLLNYPSHPLAEQAKEWKTLIEKELALQSANIP